MCPTAGSTAGVGKFQQDIGKIEADVEPTNESDLDSSLSGSSLKIN